MSIQFEEVEYPKSDYKQELEAGSAIAAFLRDNEDVLFSFPFKCEIRIILDHGLVKVIKDGKQINHG